MALIDCALQGSSLVIASINRPRQGNEFIPKRLFGFQLSDRLFDFPELFIHLFKFGAFLPIQLNATFGQGFFRVNPAPVSHGLGLFRAGDWF